jgi:hypothetical protein
VSAEDAEQFLVDAAERGLLVTADGLGPLTGSDVADRMAIATAEARGRGLEAQAEAIRERVAAMPIGVPSYEFYRWGLDELGAMRTPEERVTLEAIRLLLDA